MNPHFISFDKLNVDEKHVYFSKCLRICLMNYKLTNPTDSSK